MRAIVFVLICIFANAFAQDDGCMVCHRLRGLSVLEEGKIRDCSIRETLFAHSVHRDVGCSECHQGIEEYPHKKENAKVDCSTQCHLPDPSTKKPFSHEKIYNVWKESVHGKNYEKAKDIYPYCTYCHVNELLPEISNVQELKTCSACHQKDWAGTWLSHVSKRISLPDQKNGFAHAVIKHRRDGWEIVELCASCHEYKEKMKKAIEIEGIEDEFKKEHILTAVESYKITMHAKMLYLDRTDTRAPDCLDCHTNKDGNFHDIFREDDVRSSVHPEHISATCGRSSECHPLALKKNMKNFAMTKWFHMHPIRGESIGQTVVWVVQKVFIVLVSFVLLFASGFVILDLLKSLRK